MKNTIKTLIYVLFLLISISIVTASADNGLCTYNSPDAVWNFTTDATDCSGNNIDLTTLAGTPTYNADTGLHLDGSTYLYYNVLNFTNYGNDPFSVCFNYSYNASFDNRILVGHLDGATDNSGWDFRATGTPDFRGVMGSKNFFSLTSTLQNTWTYICMVKNSSHETIWVNGVIDVQQPYVGNVNTTNDKYLYVGTQQDVPARTWIGWIRDLSIYHSELSKTQVEAIYNKDFSGGDVIDPTCSDLYTIPANINLSSTGNIQIILNCSDETGINTTSMLLTRTAEEDATPDYKNNWSYRVPNNDKSAYSHLFDENILLADSRALGNLWYDKQSIFLDNHTFAVSHNLTATGTNPYVSMTCTDLNCILNYTAPVEVAVFPSNMYLSRGKMEVAEKHNYSIYKTYGLLVEFYDSRKARGSTDYLTQLFLNLDYLTTGATEQLEFTYCNSSYDIAGGVSPLVSESCVTLASLLPADIDTKYYTSRNSSYVKGVFSVINGKVGGIATTNRSYGYISSNTQQNKRYYVRYANTSSGTNVSFNISGVAYTTTDEGETYTNASFTPDIWFSQVSANTVVELGAYVRDTSGNYYSNFNILNDSLGNITDINLAISNPNIEAINGDADKNGTYNYLTVTVDPAIDPNGAGTVTHTLYLMNTDGSLNTTLNASFKSPTDEKINVSPDIASITSGSYKLNVSAVADDDATDVRSYLSTSFIIDVSNPVIYYTSPSGTYLNDGTIIPLVFRLYDNNDLYYFNVTIKNNETDVLMFNDSSSLSGTNYSYSVNVNNENFTNETTYKTTICVSDSHTNYKLTEADGIIKENGDMTFQFKDTIIKISNYDADLIEYTEKYSTDRYKWEYKFSDSQKYRRFYLYSNKPIDYLAHSSIKGHFIIGSYWVDFEEEQLGDVVVEKGNSNDTYYSYVVTLDTNDKKTIKFKSIGALNTICSDYYFTTASETSVYNIDLIAGNLFNNDVLTFRSTAGVLTFIFILILLMGLVVLSFATQIPAFAFLSALSWFFFGLILYVSLSAILGFLVIAISISFGIYGIFLMKN